MEEELVKQIEESELEMSIRKLSGYIDELDDRVQVLEKEFNKMNEVQQLLKCLKKELEDEWKFEKVRSAVRKGDTDEDEGG